jgi:hypothetical protein
MEVRIRIAKLAKLRGHLGKGELMEHRVAGGQQRSMAFDVVTAA